MINKLYKVTIENEAVVKIEFVAEATQEEIRMVDNTIGRRQLPRFKKVVKNNGYSYGDPTIDSMLKENIENMNLTDGKYLMTMRYEYSRYGWASGPNYYAGNIVPAM